MPRAGRPPGGQNPGRPKNAPGASGGLRGLPLSPPVPLVGPLGPQRAQKCPLGGMGPLGPHGPMWSPWGPIGPFVGQGLVRSKHMYQWGPGKLHHVVRDEIGRVTSLRLKATRVQCASRKSRSAAGAHGGPMGAPMGPRAQNHDFYWFFWSKRAGRHPTGTGGAGGEDPAEYRDDSLY